VNAYGRFFRPRRSLADVLAKLDRLPGLLRLRFVTSHPRNMTDEILKAMRDLPTVCEYLHMPAQSGSDRVLKDMRRGYTGAEYRELIARARDTVPGLAVASDFIVGFPGETDEEFRDTVAMVEDLRFQNCFVFKYSPRPGTRADRWPDDVPLEVKKKRNVTLLATQETVSDRAHQAAIGRRLEVLVEGPSKKDAHMLVGRTRTNDIVHFPGDADSAGNLAHVRVTDATPLTLSGTVISGSVPSRAGISFRRFELPG